MKEQDTAWEGRQLQDSSAIHVVPEDDIAEHKLVPSCWCQPVFDGRDLGSGDEVWVHRCAKENPQ